MKEIMVAAALLLLPLAPRICLTSPSLLHQRDRRSSAVRVAQCFSEARIHIQQSNTRIGGKNIIEFESKEKEERGGRGLFGTYRGS